MANAGKGSKPYPAYTEKFIPIYEMFHHTSQIQQLNIRGYRLLSD